MEQVEYWAPLISVRAAAEQAQGNSECQTCGASLKMSMLPLSYSGLSFFALSASNPAMENLRPCGPSAKLHHAHCHSTLPRALWLVMEANAVS